MNLILKSSGEVIMLEVVPDSQKFREKEAARILELKGVQQV